MEKSFVVVPIALSVTALFRPCLPPSITSSFILPCKSWDNNDAGYLIRLGVALVEGHAWMVATSSIGFPITIALLYPVEVVLLFIKKLEG